MDIQTIPLQGLRWPRGASARIWFCQPQIELNELAPFQPTAAVRSIDILRAVLDQDAYMGAPAGDAPSIILLPELSVAHSDIAKVREMMQAARTNTLLICGIGHMSAGDIDEIEASAYLCAPPVVGHFANCALIGCGGTDQIFLQPKVVASREELDCHWPGRVVRYFVGEFFQFVVFVCSEMLDRAQARTTIHEVVNEIDKKGLQLAAIFWLQHNPKPRSDDFLQSLEELANRDRPTIFIVASRNQCPPRLDNFCVSGAVFKKAALPRHFNLLTRRFHYVEPISNLTSLSRLVLLRYDADVNLVETILANAIEDGDRTPRSQLFGSVFPKVLQNGALLDSDANTHLAEIVRRARDRAIATDGTQTARIWALTNELVALGTLRFQNFLDRAIVPRPHEERYRHTADQQHQDGDFFCECWEHRKCIDFLCDNEDAAEPIAHLLLTLAWIVAQGLSVSLIPLPDSLANIGISGPSGEFSVCIVYPFDFNADATEVAVRGGARPKAAEPGYIILGASGRAGRPPLAKTSQAVARSTAPFRAASAADPLLRAIYIEELTAASAAGNLAQLLQQRFG